MYTIILKSMSIKRIFFLRIENSKTTHCTSLIQFYSLFMVSRLKTILANFQIFRSTEDCQSKRPIFIFKTIHAGLHTQDETSEATIQKCFISLKLFFSCALIFLYQFSKHTFSTVMTRKLWNRKTTFRLKFLL